MSATQSGHLFPRWCTVSAHDSQKRWWPQGTRARRGSLRLIRHTSQQSSDALVSGISDVIAAQNVTMCDWLNMGLNYHRQECGQWTVVGEGVRSARIFARFIAEGATNGSGAAKIGNFLLTVIWRARLCHTKSSVHLWRSGMLFTQVGIISWPNSSRYLLTWAIWSNQNTSKIRVE